MNIGKTRQAYLRLAEEASSRADAEEADLPNVKATARGNIFTAMEQPGDWAQRVALEANRVRLLQDSIARSRAAASRYQSLALELPED